MSPKRTEIDFTKLSAEATVEERPEGYGDVDRLDWWIVAETYPKHPRGPKENQQAADDFGLKSYEDLLVLSSGNDPFYCGRRQQQQDANWFGRVWQRVRHVVRHNRGVHYQWMSTPGATNSKGEPYNPDKDWTMLQNASKFARLLGIVGPEDVDDRRNEPARIYVRPRGSEPEPEASWEAPNWNLPKINPDALSSKLDLTLPGIDVHGYSYDPDDQPILLELWIEKSTMDSIIDPICRRFNVNFTSGIGFESYKAAIKLLRRIEQHNKPAHVFYISDFDLAGDTMPRAVARQVQFFRELLGIDAEVTIQPIALTAEQVERYHLPRAPIDESKRKSNGKFEAGRVELDALETLHPGELAKITREAIRSYIDETLRERLDETREEAQSSADEAWENATEELRAELEAIDSDVREVADSYRERLQELAEELEADLATYREQLDSLRDEAQRLADETIETLDLPERPEPNELDIDRERLLYDSERHWWRQLQVFRARKRGD